MPDQKQAKHFYISGQVQGVGYRYFSQRAADRLHVSGYVRNLEDGRVEVYAVGTEEQLGSFMAELRRGPSHAVVREVREIRAELIPDLAAGFSIDY